MDVWARTHNDHAHILKQFQESANDLNDPMIQYYCHERKFWED